MAGLIKRNGSYFAQFCSKPKHPRIKRRSLGTRRRPDARHELARLERLIREGRWCPWEGDLKVLETISISMRRARSVDSGSILALYGIGIAQYYSGNSGDASRSLQQLMRQAPGHQYAWGVLMMTYLEGGQFVDATAMLNRIADPSPACRSDLGAYCFAKSGVRQSAMEVVEELGDSVSAWNRARVFAGLGESELAIGELQGYMDDPPREMIALAIEPAFEPLCGDRRFQEMLRDLGLSGEEGTSR